MSATRAIAVVANSYSALDVYDIVAGPPRTFCSLYDLRGGPCFLRGGLVPCVLPVTAELGGILSSLYSPGSNCPPRSNATISCRNLFGTQ
jgi:hypothetical protein